MSSLPFSIVSSSSSFSHNRIHAYASNSMPEFARVPIPLPKMLTSSSSNLLVQQFNGPIQTTVPSQKDVIFTTSQTFQHYSCDPNRSKAMIQLHAILVAVADRIEMHKSIEDQRNIWNCLLLNSINMMILSASAMVALNTAIHNTALKLTSTVLFTAATGMLIIMNKFQPSQMAQEQRNGTNLFKQLRSYIQAKLTLGNPTQEDVNSAMERVMALDKAYPSKFEYQMKVPELEKEMRENIEVEKRRDMGDDVYERLRNLALVINKTLAILGPLLTGIAALGSAFVSHGSSWPGIVAAMAGSLATSVNALERVGQVGMVYEMYRSFGGLFKFLQEIIEATREKKDDSDRKKTTAHHEMKVAMELGRSVKINLMIGI
ncbi:probable F-box protein At4g22030 [Neltuma alba]|uniref:probable F-box protein At4g22030 n=1 Tax=Neltuma alba TaxID=207710 RepID=UPI0010A44C03|nr:probable F-box protein At4g22030 [Prosopis alba]